MIDCPTEDGLRKERTPWLKGYYKLGFPHWEGPVCFYERVDIFCCSLRICLRAWRKLKTPVLVMNTCILIPEHQDKNKGLLLFLPPRRGGGICFIQMGWIWDLALGKGLCCLFGNKEWRGNGIHQACRQKVVGKEGNMKYVICFNALFIERQEFGVKREGDCPNCRKHDCQIGVSAALSSHVKCEFGSS